MHINFNPILSALIFISTSSQPRLLLPIGSTQLQLLLLAGLTAKTSQTIVAYCSLKHWTGNILSLIVTLNWHSPLVHCQRSSDSRSWDTNMMALSLYNRVNLWAAIQHDLETVISALRDTIIIIRVDIFFTCQLYVICIFKYVIIPTIYYPFLKTISFIYTCTSRWNTRKLTIPN